ncbi:hypothetical protein RJ639_021056 [Escallonia herrerae]|uniref:Uncharacterized protein n=1 Tax=Escallonia herrerae TaxID=1293975 RepID=A0AA88V2B8_9ASTE|nr:hypothetical protein RJ639_021056 [Escallonia herrerae]
MVDAEAGKEEEPEESKEDVVVKASKKSKRAKKADAAKEDPKKRSSESSAKEAAAATPSERPSRERKTVERMAMAFKLSKKKPDDNLQILHSILFGKRTKAHSLKKNIGLFSGFVWVESEKHKQDSQAGKKRKHSSKVEEDEVEPSESKDDFQENDSDAKPKVESEQEDNQQEEAEEEVKQKMQLSSEKSSSKKNVKKDSGGKTGGNSKSIEESSPLKPAKTLPQSKKDHRLQLQRKVLMLMELLAQLLDPRNFCGVENFSISVGIGKGEIVKKAKAEPTKEEMNAVVVNILKEVDFNTLSSSCSAFAYFEWGCLNYEGEAEDEGEEDGNKDNDA